MALLIGLLDSILCMRVLWVSLLFLFVYIIWDDLVDDIPYTQFPLAGKSQWDIFNLKAKSQFIFSPRALLLNGFSQSTTAFQVMDGATPLIVLHPKYIDEIKNNPHLNLEAATRKKYFDGRFPGFQPFHGPGTFEVIIDVVRKRLTQALGVLTIPLSKEAAEAVNVTLPPSRDWDPHNFFRKAPFMIARLSSLVFLGENICRDVEWLNISVNYTIDAFQAARELRLCPSIFRPLIHWILPSARRLRKHLYTARGIVSKEIEKRATSRQIQAHESPDALNWLREASESFKSGFDQSYGQIGLSLVAVHTTSSLLTNVIYDLAAYPEYIQPLRDEIKDVLAKDDGLKKTSLSKLRLMDSVMKESQRLNPLALAFLNRVAERQVSLSDGTVIPKGATIVVSAHTFMDEAIYTNASHFDGYRFYNKRLEPGSQHNYQLVTTSGQHFAFGHGVHACPGRFFAANESKILLIHLLLKYEWKFKEDRKRPKNIEFGIESIPDPTIELLFRSRQPEIDLAVLGE